MYKHFSEAVVKIILGQMLGFSKGIEMQQTLENVVKCLWSYDCSLYKLIISYEGAIVLVSQLVGGTKPY